jgi:hypothetical protein
MTYLGPKTSQISELPIQAKNDHSFIAILSFDNANFDLRKNIVSVERPKFSIINGKKKPAPLKITFRDVVTNDVSKLLFKQIESQLINQWSNFSLEIQTIQNTILGCNIIESFKLSDCKISEIDYGSFNYSSCSNLIISVLVTFESSIHFLS